VHDVIDIAVNKQLTKLWEVIPHHVAVSIVILFDNVTANI